ncbi:hypothetical protein AB0E69_23525 [Kribbella sp. NPDC026611]|uniref:hypothetical protein n=1 Tax=Kribbella sp. NPDC026611 TaxID=3154911 RepID=UPI0033C78389
MTNFATEGQQRRIEELFGFKGELIRDEVVARAAAASRSYVDGFYPPSAPGSVRWIHTVSSLREALVPLGYVPSEAGQLSRAVNYERRVAILPSTGSSRTGMPFYIAGKHPTTKWPKGERLAEAVKQNAQLALFGNEPEPAEGDFEDPALETWMLLQHATKEEVRSELSLPADINSKGFITSWRVRLILPPHSNEGGPVDDYDDGDDDSIDVPVEPK